MPYYRMLHGSYHIGPPLHGTLCRVLDPQSLTQPRPPTHGRYIAAEVVVIQSDHTDLAAMLPGQFVPIPGTRVPGDSAVVVLDSEATDIVSDAHRVGPTPPRAEPMPPDSRRPQPPEPPAPTPAPAPAPAVPIPAPAAPMASPRKSPPRKRRGRPAAE